MEVKTGQTSETPSGDFDSWVAFCFEAERPITHFIGKDKHCFVMVKCAHGLACIDPLAHSTEVQVIPTHFNIDDIIRFMVGNGMEIVPYRRSIDESRPMPVGLHTCVEAVKRVVGVRDWRIQTPGQLRQHLLKHNGGVVYGQPSPGTKGSPK